MASISFNCTQCGQGLMIDESAAGTTVQCPTCSSTLRVPTPKPKPPSGPVIEAPPLAPEALVGSEQMPPRRRGLQPYYETVVRFFFLVALVTFFAPVAVSTSGVSSSNRQSPFEMIMQTASVTRSKAYRNVKEIMVNGGELVKEAGKSAFNRLAAMLGLIVLWIAVIGLGLYCLVVAISALMYFNSGTPPSRLLKFAIGCALQFVPLMLISGSLLKLGTMPAESSGVGAEMSVLWQVTVAPAWGAWLLGIAGVAVLSTPKLYERFCGTTA